MVSLGTLSDLEIKKGRFVENQLEFGDLLFRSLVVNPKMTMSGLIYGHTEEGALVYTKVDPIFLNRLK